MNKNFYITTPLYYVNAKPHIGSAYTTIVADCLAKYKRKAGFDVFFLTGTDEHGLKIYRSAQKAGIDTQKFVDEVANSFKKIWKQLDIRYDYFIRTTDKKHEDAVRIFFEKLLENGDIYKGKYEGWYCVHDERYFTEKELLDGNLCPECKRPVEWVTEENYFFKLSKYQDRLIKHFEEHPDFVEPEFRKNEILSRLKSEKLEDLSVSRSSFPWGVPMPGDENHVIYVWFDALLNYITALGYGDENDENFKKYWPADVHFIGKEINWFHSVIWPAMLMAADIELPKKIFAHGWLTVNGEKISKSKGNAIDPIAIAKEYSIDALKYYMLRDIKFGKDGDFSHENLVKRINYDLANDLGNLLSRTVQMIIKYFDGKIPEPKAPENEYDKDLREMGQTLFENVDKLIDKYDFTEALETIWRFIRRTNKYIDETEPWILAKKENKERLDRVLYNLAESLRIVAILISPFMENTAKKIFVQLGLKPQDVPNIGFDKAVWGGTVAGTEVRKGAILFPRIDLEKKEEEKNKKKANQKEQVKEIAENVIEFADFEKVELRIAQVIKVEDIEGADKLYKLTLNDGDGERIIAAGIKKFYKKEELSGKKIVIVANLKPRKLRGVLSHGMLLAASNKNGLSILTLDKDIENIIGTRVK